jgi:hypothetical protein
VVDRVPGVRNEEMSEGLDAWVVTLNVRSDLTKAEWAWR